VSSVQAKKDGFRTKIRCDPGWVRPRMRVTVFAAHPDDLAEVLEPAIADVLVHESFGDVIAEAHDLIA